MAMGVVVVEAARKSGAMITVDFALEQGKEVFAVPGCADSYASGGTNLLIQNGAKLVTGVDDILEELNILEHHAADTGRRGTHDEPSRIEATGEVNGEGRAIIEMLKSTGTVYVDDFLECEGITPEKLPEVLLRMELRGQVKAIAGGKYTLN